MNGLAPAMPTMWLLASIAASVRFGTGPSGLIRPSASAALRSALAWSEWMIAIRNR